MDPNWGDCEGGMLPIAGMMALAKIKHVLEIALDTAIGSTIRQASRGGVEISNCEGFRIIPCPTQQSVLRTGQKPDVKSLSQSRYSPFDLVPSSIFSAHLIIPPSNTSSRSSTR